jgi:hypothetical protein
MTTQGSNTPDSEGKKQESVARGGLVGEDRSKDFSGDESEPSFGGPQDSEREPGADESGRQAQ